MPEDRTSRSLGWLAAIIAAPFIALAVYVVGGGLWGLAFDRHESGLYCIVLVFGSIPAAIGALLGLASWALIRESGAVSGQEQGSAASRKSSGDRLLKVLAVGVMAEVAILALIGVLSSVSNTPASVVTNDATGVTANGATLNGELTDLNDAEGHAHVSFLWGPRSDYYPNQTIAVARKTEGAFSFQLGGLSSKTTYYYIAWADSGDCGASHGAERSFTTR